MDTLCIIQNDEADKSREIGLMARTYGNAYVTIVASIAKSASKGFLRPRQPHNEGITLPFRVLAGLFGSVTVQTMHKLARSACPEIEEPIDERAWTLQEQLIAKRLLLYSTHTLQSRCAAGTMSLGQSLEVDFAYPIKAKLLSQLSADPKEALTEWLRIVETYSPRSASLERDKLPAIAAVAEKFAPLFGRFYAGVWTYAILRQLGWQEVLSSAPKLDQKFYRAPSWSWASVNGPVRYIRRCLDDQVACTLISAKVSLKDTKVPYGEVIEGSITVQAKLLLVWISIPRWVLAGNYDVATVNALYHFHESPMTRFFKNYFQQSASSTIRSLNKKVPVRLVLDECRKPRGDGLVCKYWLRCSVTLTVDCANCTGMSV